MRNVEGNQGLSSLDYSDRLPQGSLSLKQLFLREAMDRFFVSPDILYHIAGQILSYMECLAAFEDQGIFPGLWDLEDIFYDPESHRVYLTCLDRFQQGEKEQDYEWFPEDEKLFGDLVYFDHASQTLANERLLYKVLIAAAKGNVKLPPLPGEADYSEEFYHLLDEEIRQHFVKRFGRERDACDEAAWTFDKWKEKLNKEKDDISGLLQTDKDMSLERDLRSDRDIDADRDLVLGRDMSLDRDLRSDRDIDADRGLVLDRDMTSDRELASGQEAAAPSPMQETGPQSGETPVIYDMFLLLRRNYNSSLTMSQLLYECMDELEEKELGKTKRLQAFFYGDQCIQVRDFASYPRGFRLQMANQIRHFSIGELLLLAADRLDDLLDGRGYSLDVFLDDLKDGQKEIRVHLLADHRLANDRLFQYALNRLKSCKERGVSFILHTGKEAEGEAIDKLRETLTDHRTER